MGQQTIGIGSAANDGTGDPLRTAGQKINANFDELYGVTGQSAMIPIMASGMQGRTTSGAASGTTETTSNKVMLATLDFDPDADEFAQFMVPMPESWDEGTVTAKFLWTAGATGDVIWSMQAVAISNDDPLDAAFGAAQSVTDSVTAADDLMISDETAAITIGGSPAAGDLVVFQVYRDADNVSDTLAADAKLIAVRLYITTDDYEDS